MYTGSFRGFESRCPAYGLLAQLGERRLALAGWYAQVRCLHSPREYGVFHAVRVWARPSLAREPVGVLLCSRSSQSSSGTGWVYSVRGGILVDTLDLGSSVPCGVWVRVPPGALAAEVFGVSSCRSRSTRVMMGGTRFAGLAQLVEQPPCKRLVGGSIPPSGSGFDGGA